MNCSKSKLVSFCFSIVIEVRVSCRVEVRDLAIIGVNVFLIDGVRLAHLVVIVRVILVIELPGVLDTEDEQGVSKELGANVQHLKLVIPGFNEAISLSNSKLSVSITQLLLEVVIHFEGRFILSFVHNVGTDVHDDNSQDTP